MITLCRHLTLCFGDLESSLLHYQSDIYNEILFALGRTLLILNKVVKAFDCAPVL